MCNHNGFAQENDLCFALTSHVRVITLKHDTYCFSRESSMSTAPWKSGLRRMATTRTHLQSGGTRSGRCLWVWMSMESHWEGRKPAGRTWPPTSSQLWCEVKNSTGEGGYAALDWEVFNTEKKAVKLRHSLRNLSIGNKALTLLHKNIIFAPDFDWAHVLYLVGGDDLCFLWHGMQYLSFFFLCQTVCNWSLCVMWTTQEILSQLMNCGRCRSISICYLYSIFSCETLDNLKHKGER